MTRSTQPFRRGPRSPGPVLSAMKRGRTAFGQNPMDVQRATARRARRRKARGMLGRRILG